MKNVLSDINGPGLRTEGVKRTFTDRELIDFATNLQLHRQFIEKRLRRANRARAFLILTTRLSTNARAAHAADSFPFEHAATKGLTQTEFLAVTRQ